MPRYSKDPRWLSSRFSSKCAKCGSAISRGEQIFWYPLTKSAYGSKCGCADDAAADFNSAAFDESVMTGEW